jgi:tetratricopeptide (TPR) repeat protein
MALGPEHFDVAVSASNVALKLHALSRDAEAEPLMLRAVEQFTKLFGGDSTRVAMNLVNQSEILTGLGRFADAHAALSQALATFKRQKATAFYVGYALLDLGKLYVAERAARPAVSALEESVNLLGNQDRLVTAEARFALSRALWIASAHERERSVAIARDTYDAVAKEPGAARLLHEIETWQGAHNLGGQRLKVAL